MNKFSLYKIFYAAALLTGCCFVSGCENDEKVINDMTKRVVMKEEAVNIESMLSQQGKLRAILKAPLMIRVFDDTVYAEFPKSLHCDFYDSSTRIETWLDSKQGRYYENLNKVYLWDSVTVISRTGDTLKCKDLWWDQNARLFYTGQYTEYHTKGNQYYGNKGMEATQDLRRVTFKEGGGTVKMSENGFPQ